MIGFLKGKIEYINGSNLYINVGGVGYKVLVSNIAMSSFSANNGEVTVYTYTYVREDALELFGFLKREDIKIFEYLISVSGIGPKTAMNIFSSGTTEQIIHAIQSSDVNFFVGVPRLGKKNAQKIIIELRNKITKDDSLSLSDIDSSSRDEVISALKSIGFSTKEIHEAVKNIKSTDESTEEKIKSALKYLSK